MRNERGQSPGLKDLIQIGENPVGPFCYWTERGAPLRDYRYDCRIVIFTKRKTDSNLFCFVVRIWSDGWTDGSIYQTRQYLNFLVPRSKETRKNKRIQIK